MFQPLWHFLHYGRIWLHPWLQNINHNETHFESFCQFFALMATYVNTIYIDCAHGRIWLHMVTYDDDHGCIWCKQRRSSMTAYACIWVHTPLSIMVTYGHIWSHVDANDVKKWQHTTKRCFNGCIHGYIWMRTWMHAFQIVITFFACMATYGCIWMRLWPHMATYVKHGHIWLHIIATYGCAHGRICSHRSPSRLHIMQSWLHMAAYFVKSCRASDEEVWNTGVNAAPVWHIKCQTTRFRRWLRHCRLRASTSALCASSRYFMVAYGCTYGYIWSHLM